MGLIRTLKSLGWCFHSCLPSTRIHTFWKDETPAILNAHCAHNLCLMMYLKHRLSVRYTVYTDIQIYRDSTSICLHWDTETTFFNTAATPPHFPYSLIVFVCVCVQNRGIPLGKGIETKQTSWRYYGSIHTVLKEHLLYL